MSCSLRASLGFVCQRYSEFLSAVKVIAQIQWNGATEEIGAGRGLAKEINGR